MESCGGWKVKSDCDTGTVCPKCPAVFERAGCVSGKGSGFVFCALVLPAPRAPASRKLDWSLRFDVGN